RFYLQAEDGIRDGHVTGVQTCALPIFALAWSPDGRTLAVANDNNVLRLYRAGSKYTPVGGNLSPEDDSATALDIAPDGRTIAVEIGRASCRERERVSVARGDGGRREEE